MHLKPNENYELEDVKNLKNELIRMKFISVFLQISKPPVRIVNMEALAVTKDEHHKPQNSKQGQQ